MSKLQRGVNLLYLSRADVEALHCGVSDVPACSGGSFSGEGGG